MNHEQIKKNIRELQLKVQGYKFLREMEMPSCLQQSKNAEQALRTFQRDMRIAEGRTLLK